MPSCIFHSSTSTHTSSYSFGAFCPRAPPVFIRQYFQDNNGSCSVASKRTTVHPHLIVRTGRLVDVTRVFSKKTVWRDHVDGHSAWLGWSRRASASGTDRSVKLLYRNNDIFYWLEAIHNHIRLRTQTSGCIKAQINTGVHRIVHRIVVVHFNLAVVERLWTA